MKAISTRSWMQGRWPILKRILSLAFLAAVATFLVVEARQVNWEKVHAALHATPASTLAIAAAFGMASHALFSTFDLVGRFHVRSRLPVPLVMAVNFISYAFNLSFGAIVGAFAVRYRLYLRLGVEVADVTRILSLSIVTNWGGYILLAGILLVWQPLDIPREWVVGADSLRGIGVLMLVMAAAYVALCATSRRHEWHCRGHLVVLPSARVALLQLLVSCANWLLMCALVHTLLGERLDFGEVAFCLLISAVAGVITHVPAGAGVMEGVFLALLSHRVPSEEILAALLVYRFVYYLLPLLLAALLFLVLEARAKKPVG